MAKHKVLSNDADIDKALAQSASTAEEAFVSGATLENVGGEPSILLRMSDGSIHGIPKSKLERLADATHEVASNVEVSEDGLGLRWPDLDLDMYVPSLLQGIYGTRAWMSSLGRFGGRVRSVAKSNAARLNGLKGGRPRKRTSCPSVGSLSSAQRNESHFRRAHTLRDPFCTSPSYSMPSVFNRADFAKLFGFDASASAQPLPRIA